MIAQEHDRTSAACRRPIGRTGGSPPPRARRGAALFILLVFIGLAAVFVTGWLTTAAAERRADRLAAERLQAAWLAESAVERAAAQLARDRGYQGETWEVSAADLDSVHHATITIRIDRRSGAVEKQETSALAMVDVQLRDTDQTVASARKQVSIHRLTPEESP